MRLQWRKTSWLLQANTNAEVWEETIKFLPGDLNDIMFDHKYPRSVNAMIQTANPEKENM